MLSVPGVPFFRPFGHKTYAICARSIADLGFREQNRPFSLPKCINNADREQNRPNLLPKTLLQLRLWPKWLAPLRFKPERLPLLTFLPERLPQLAFLSATRKARSMMTCHRGGWKGYWRALPAQIAARSVA